MSDRRTVHALVMQLIESGDDGSARALMLKNCVGDTRFVDRVVMLYIARGNKRNQTWMNSGYEEYCSAYTLLGLKPSRRVREQLLAAFVTVGFRGHARRIAQSLGRRLTVAEFKALGLHYTEGATQSSGDKAEIRALAREVGGDELEAWACEELRKMDVRWEQDSLL